MVGIFCTLVWSGARPNQDIEYANHKRIVPLIYFTSSGKAIKYEACNEFNKVNSTGERIYMTNHMTLSLL